MLTFVLLVGPLVVHRRQRGKSKLCFWRHSRCLVQCSVSWSHYFLSQCRSSSSYIWKV